MGLRRMRRGLGAEAGLHTGGAPGQVGVPGDAGDLAAGEQAEGRFGLFSLKGNVVQPVARAVMFLNQAAISSVAREDAGDAAGLFNAARNLGGSVGLALLATLQDQRWEFHRWTLHSALGANNLNVQDWEHVRSILLDFIFPVSFLDEPCKRFFQSLQELRIGHG